MTVKGSVLSIDNFRRLDLIVRRGTQAENTISGCHLPRDEPGGDHREAIFRSEPDCQLLLDTLAEACAKTDWQIHAWCWMSNHFTFACSGGGATAAKPFGKSCWRK